MSFLPSPAPSTAVAPSGALTDEIDVAEAAVEANKTAQQAAGTLSGKMYAGVGWTAFSSLFGQVLMFLRTLVLARLLSTGDFGLIGMAYTVTGALQSLTDFNLGTSAIVAKFEDDKQMHRHFNTVWTVNIVRGLLVSLILLAAAYPTASFYGDHRLTPILMVIAWTPLFLSLNNIGLTMAMRHIDFGLMAKFGTICNVLSWLIIVGLAFWTRNVWALVWGNLLSIVPGVILSYKFHPYRPRFQFDRREFDTSFGFGKWMFVIGFMSYITITADNVLVGRLLGADVLGAYLIAYSVASLPQNLVSQILGNVLLPSFAELGRGEQERLDKTVLRIFLLGAALMTLTMMPIAFLAPEIVHVAFGDKWQAAVAPLRVLIFVGFFRGLIRVLTPLIVGTNRPEIEARSTIASAVVFVAALYPLTLRFGMVGAAWAGVLTYALAFAMRVFTARQLAPHAFARFPLVLGICALSAAVGAAASAFVLGFLAHWGLHFALLRLLVGGAVAVLVSGALLLVLQPTLKDEFARVWQLIQKRFAGAKTLKNV